MRAKIKNTWRARMIKKMVRRNRNWTVKLQTRVLPFWLKTKAMFGHRVLMINTQWQLAKHKVTSFVRMPNLAFWSN